MNMSGTEKLSVLLFNGEKELANIKFFPGSKPGLTVDELHGAAADAINLAIASGLENLPPMSGRQKSRLA